MWAAMPLPSLLIVDDFLTNPHLARKAALALRCDATGKDGNYPGTLSTRPLPITGLEESVARLIGTPVTPQPGTSHGHCRLTLATDRGLSGVHVDPCFYSGILYLNLPEHCRGGTDFFTHKRTGLDRIPADMAQVRAAGYDDPNRLGEELHRADAVQPAAVVQPLDVSQQHARVRRFAGERAIGLSHVLRGGVIS
jgi:hypothetical protein